ncbi:hypothetical protein [Rhodococcus sp. HNM0569]|uniref:hypothetical protein n=1 Tax=Rhodococcus sp. HNM0569 TaxID=2716340 RepID=UPI00146AA2A9|nr:hypothetical protein [Rhodococcus sp. HNM0569]NLU82698.1 hypothetical protein [Rhodococcus sp. HNM0569]
MTTSFADPATLPARADHVGTLHIAVELSGAGHHPAAAGLPGATPVGPARWIDFTSPSSRPLDLSARPAEVVRVRATDLREARAAYASVLDDALRGGRLRPVVLADVEVLLAPDARRARRLLRELDAAESATPTTLRYVGTPLGLAGLVADIGAAHVADGVTLLPLTLPGALEHIVTGTIPWLRSRGLVVDSDAVERAAGAVGLEASARRAS